MTAEFQPNSNHSDLYRPTDFCSDTQACEELDSEDERLWTLLSAYADGEATPEESAEVEVLLRSEPAYARDLAFLRRTAWVVPHMIEVEPPVGLRDTIFAQTIYRPTLKKRWALALQDWRKTLIATGGRYALAGGALAAAGVAAFLLLPRPGPHIEPSGLAVTSSRPILTSSPTRTGEINGDLPKAAVPKKSSEVAADTPLKVNLPPEMVHTADQVVKAADPHAAVVQGETDPKDLRAIVKKTPAAFPLPKKDRLVNVSFPPHRYDNSSDGSESRYVVNPQMDALNQHMIKASVVDNEGANIDTPIAPDSGTTPPGDGVPTPRMASNSGRMVASSLSAIPPDDQYSPSNKELIATLRARTGGLPEDVVRNNGRGQAQITLARLVLR